MASFEFSDEDLKIFFEETEELLQAMEDGLIGLEKGDLAEANLASIFRAAHTIKGSSATVGFTAMATLTHSMENVLDRLRKGQVRVSTAIVNHLFTAMDVLRKLTADAAAGRESNEDTSAARQLMELDLEEDETAAPPAGTTTPVPVSPPAPGPVAPTVAPPAPAPRPPAALAVAAALPWAGLDLEESERQVLSDGCARGDALLKVRVEFHPDTAMLSVRCYQAYLHLEDRGRLAVTRPTLSEIEQEKSGAVLTAFLFTSEDPKVLAGEIENIGDVRAVEVEPVGADGLVSAGSPSGAAEAATTTPTTGTAISAGAAAAPEPSGGRPGAASDAPAAPSVAPPESRAGAKTAMRTVRVDVELLDNLMNLVGELVIDRTRLAQSMGLLDRAVESKDSDLTRELAEATAHVGRITTQLQEEIMRARMLPVETLFKKFPRMVRDLAQKCGKQVELVIEGQDTELDRGVIEEIGDPIMHLLRNSLDHGIEPPEARVAAGKPPVGLVRLSASHLENHILITVEDDGKGIEVERVKSAAVRKGFVAPELAARMSTQEALQLIFVSGVSTAEKVSEVSGRGVGMDVVRRNVEKLNATIEMDTTIGVGTRTTIKLPLTLAIIRALMVQSGSGTFAIPMASVVETLVVELGQLKTIRGAEVIVNRGQVLPVHRLTRLFADPCEGDPRALVIVSVGGAKSGLLVDKLLGDQEVVVKNLGLFLGSISGLSGATILGGGEVALIIDAQSLLSLHTSMATREELIA